MQAEYTSLNFPDRGVKPGESLSSLSQFELANNVGKQDMIFFYFGSTDRCDTSGRFSLTFAICGQETISLVKDERAVLLWSRDGTKDYEQYSLYQNWFYQSFKNMNKVIYPMCH
jgi:hypothetical protein